MLFFSSSELPHPPVFHTLWSSHILIFNEKHALRHHYQSLNGNVIRFYWFTIKTNHFGIKHTQCSDSYLFVIDHGFICPVLYRLFCLTKCLVALLWSRHLTMYSLISIFHTDLYRYGLFQIYLWNKQIWKAIPACCVESLWWYFVGIPVEWKLGGEISAWFCVWKCGFPRPNHPDINALVDRA